MDKGLALEIIFSVCGGLGIFLLGMKNMSEGMQAVAGERLRKMIGAITNNRLMASGVGTLVTCDLYHPVQFRHNGDGRGNGQRQHYDINTGHWRDSRGQHRHHDHRLDSGRQGW
ncbi:MAG: hypothetical protein ACYTCV_09035 [Planctomycetota bacterium]